MNKRKFFLLPICLFLLGACNSPQPSSQAGESKADSESSDVQDISTEHVHSFGDWSTVKEATCTEAGTKERKCSGCDEVETESIDALGHSYGNWVTRREPTCTETGLDVRTCSRCQGEEEYVVDALGHDWDDGVVTTQPTTAAEGVKTFTCKRVGCGATRTESIDKLVAATGYTVTFVPGNHCKVFVYSTKNYDNETPVETNTCKAKDEEGNVIDYDENAALQPQVNFKVVCDDGYVVSKDNMAVTGTFKNLKQGPDTKEGLPAGFFRITKIQTDLTVTITPVADSGEEQNPGYEATFITSHCSVKVYVGPKDKNNATEDTAEKFFGRSKDSPYDYTMNQGQLNFEVIPDAGYKFVSGLEEGAEGKVSFIAGTGDAPYNKVVRGATDYANCYRITKMASDLAVRVKCIPEAGEAGLGYEITFATEHCSVLVYEDGQDYRFTPTAPVDNKTLSRTDDGDATKYVAKDEANGIAEVKPQVNFLVVCDEGYEFNSGIEVNAEASGVSFITGNYNKVKNMGDGIYRVTKIKGDLTITITATAKAA